MPRAAQPIEERIIGHFREAPLGEAKLLHRLVSSIVKERAEEVPAQAPRPAGARKTHSKSKPAARSQASGKKASSKKKATSRGSAAGSARAGHGAGAPADEEMP